MQIACSRQYTIVIATIKNLERVDITGFSTPSSRLIEVGDTIIVISRQLNEYMKNYD